MNNLLRDKLTKLLEELKENHKEIIDTFCKYKGKQNATQLLSGYEKEKLILKKYKCNRLEIIDYAVKLDFAIADLHLILHKHLIK